MEIMLQICDRLDSVSLYRITLVSGQFRQISTHAPWLWDVIVLDPHVKFDSALLHSLLCFLVKFRLHFRVRSARFDRHPTIDLATLESFLQYLPRLKHLSVVQCPQIDCWQILRLLKTAAKNNASGAGAEDEDEDEDGGFSTVSPKQMKSRAASGSFLRELCRLELRGSFPSERNHKSYGHEMYCYGEIKQTLLSFSFYDDDRPQGLSENHYALYQFWLLLRSRMLTVVRDSSDRNSTSNDHQPFRPSWLPDTLLRFIHLTETEDPSAPVKMDIEPCQLCYKNVAVSGNTPCRICGAVTPIACVQCMCLQCSAVLCWACYRQCCHLSTRTAADQHQHQQQQQPTPWRVIRCHQCDLSRRVCGDPACVDPLLTPTKRRKKWYCGACREQHRNERWKARPRFLRHSSYPNQLLRWDD
ncbi:hypothetical protein DFQ28_011731 [Apophysomyces sp. BC1034]|nr:hypothetical protein DFQ28_011731 [Apophysomyces sp. BC1034]